jgi:hypothetical protein
MDSQVQLCAKLCAAPGALVSWLHTLANTLVIDLPEPNTLIVGPHTFTAAEPEPYETLALYMADRRVAHDIPARQVVLSATYMPLRHSEIGLDLRVWPSFPTALETLKYHFSDYFTQANPVLSSAVALHFVGSATMLVCNQWLFTKLATPAYHDLKAAKQLYPSWLEQYRALKGVYPADPRRGFRAQIALHPHFANQKRKLTRRDRGAEQ